MDQQSNFGQFAGGALEAFQGLTPDMLQTLQTLVAVQAPDGSASDLLGQLGQQQNYADLLASIGAQANMPGFAPQMHQQGMPQQLGGKGSSKRGGGGEEDVPRTRYHVYSEDQKQLGLQYLQKYGNCSAAARHLRQDNPDAFPTVTGAHVSFWDKANKRKLGLLPSEPTKRQKAAAGGSIPGAGSVGGSQMQVHQQAASLDANVHLQLITLIRDIITTQLSAGMTISPEMLRPLVVSCINACGLGYLLEENGGTFQVTDQWLAQVCSIIALTASGGQQQLAVEGGDGMGQHAAADAGAQHTGVLDQGLAQQGGAPDNGLAQLQQQLQQQHAPPDHSLAQLQHYVAQDGQGQNGGAHDQGQLQGLSQYQNLAAPAEGGYRVEEGAVREVGSQQ